MWKKKDAEEDVKKDEPKRKDVSIRKDLDTILFITYLYFLQGVVFGLSSVVPLILGEREVGYSEQGTFSFANWPFSIKLVW
jgi:hypothetical protein